MKNLKVFAIILNFNHASETIECIESLSKQTYSNLQILVVDNGSEDGSPQIIAAKFPSVTQINLPENLGFSRGINAGISHALTSGADYLFIINNDTILDSSCIETLVSSTKENTGILAPIIYYRSQPDKIWSIGGKLSPLTLDMHTHTTIQWTQVDLPESLDQDFVTGCGMFIPRKTFDEIGFFDEKYFLYYEDIDFCHSVRSAGFKIVAIKQAKMWHKVALSSGGLDSPNERYWSARSGIRYFRKHARVWQYLFIIPWRLGSAIRTTIRLINSNKLDALAAYWRGIKDGIKDMNKEN